MDRERAFLMLIDDLKNDIDDAYIVLALKKVSDQQLLFIDFSAFRLLDDPILKVLDLCVREIEHFLFESEWAVANNAELSGIIQDCLEKSMLPEPGDF